MLTFDPTHAAIYMVSAFAAALAALVFVGRIDPTTRADRRRILISGEDAAIPVFLFDSDRLVDSTRPAKQILAGSECTPGSDWAKMIEQLEPQFDDLSTALADLGDCSTVAVPANDGGARLVAEWRGRLLRVSLQITAAPEAWVDIDSSALAAMRAELDTLRANAEHMPYPVWRQTVEGRVTWANRAYLDFVRRARPDADLDVWPPPAMFDRALLFQAAEDGTPRRLTVPAAGGAALCFECHGARVGDEVLFAAIDAGAAVHAETQLREFMQTLTKTFAHLPTGLAIFDRSRRLALFNPALTELTTLPIDFLTGRPSLSGFLDRLRERRRMPEPKNYATWRQQMADLEARAVNGTYAETWSLPTGQTYRVTGRPHPDGAVAFLFEDISSEISLTRKFRAELEMGQAVIDGLDDAIAVFSDSGDLTLSNRAYARLWGHDPDTVPVAATVVDATRDWLTKTAPTPVWGDLRDFVGQFGEREPWEADVTLNDGRGLRCRFAPISQGATMVSFAVQASEAIRPAIAAHSA